MLFSFAIFLFFLLCFIKSASYKCMFFPILPLPFRAVIRKCRLTSVPNNSIKSKRENSLPHMRCFRVSNKRSCEKGVSPSDYY